MIRAQHIGKISLDFEQRKPRTWFVEAGHSFRHLGDQFTIRPTHATDYRALIAALGPAVAEIKQVLHLWNVDPPNRTRGVDAQLERSFFAPLRLVQELGREELRQHLDVTMVSTGVHRVAGEPTTEPVKATLLGPSRVMQRELPNMTCRHIDVEASASAWQQRRTAKQIAREMRDTGSRSNHRVPRNRSVGAEFLPRFSGNNCGSTINRGRLPDHWRSWRSRSGDCRATCRARG